MYIDASSPSSSSSPFITSFPVSLITIYQGTNDPPTTSF
jgi:hypothetical protein